MKYEYKTVFVSIPDTGFSFGERSAQKLEETLNEYVAKGWEYVNNVRLGAGDVCVLIFRKSV